MQQEVNLPDGPADIDRSGKVWIYRPEDHKTAHHDVLKAVPILGEARKSLTPFLFTDGLCFVNSAGNAWCKDTYRISVERACDRAKVKRWTPYQLRRLAAQVVRDSLGAEHAQALLGHTRMDMTEVYAKVSGATGDRGGQGDSPRGSGNAPAKKIARILPQAVQLLFRGGKSLLASKVLAEGFCLTTDGKCIGLPMPPAATLSKGRNDNGF